MSLGSNTSSKRRERRSHTWYGAFRTKKKREIKAGKSLSLLFLILLLDSIVWVMLPCAVKLFPVYILPDIPLRTLGEFYKLTAITIIVIPDERHT